MRLTLLVALISFFGVRLAHASCDSAITALSPPSGASLPPHPTIYLFDTDHETNVRDSLSITRDGDERSDPIRFRVTKVSTSRDYTVHRIELYWVSERDRSISVSWQGEVLARYSISTEDRIDEARVVDVRHDKSFWTCSFTNVIDVAVEGNAIAYQLEWDDDRTTVLAELEIGHPSCRSYNVERELLATQRSFELYALFADGMVKKIGSSVLQLDEHTVRLPTELIRGADIRFPRRFSVAVTTSPHWVFASGGAGGLGGALLVLALGRRRRRLRTRESPLSREVPQRSPSTRSATR